VEGHFLLSYGFDVGLVDDGPSAVSALARLERNRALLGMERVLLPTYCLGVWIVGYDATGIGDYWASSFYKHSNPID
jgi:hypothetical protein